MADKNDFQALNIKCLFINKWQQILDGNAAKLVAEHNFGVLPAKPDLDLYH